MQIANFLKSFLVFSSSNYVIDNEKEQCFFLQQLLFIFCSAVGAFSNFSPTQDIHPTLELKWPFDCELWRRFSSVSGHWYFSGYCLDLHKKQRKEQAVGATDIYESDLIWWVKMFCATPTCWKQACTKFSGKRFRMRSKKASTLDTSSFFFPCPRLAFNLGFPGWMSSTRITPRTAAITVVDM